MSSVSKTERCVDRSILGLQNVYQEYMLTCKLMTSQVLQRALPLRESINVLSTERAERMNKSLLNSKLSQVPRVRFVIYEQIMQYQKGEAYRFEDL